jgi:hypothetical protein
MSNWFRHIALMAQARTGASGSYFVLILLAVLALAAALVSFWLAAFMWLANRYGGVQAGLILGGVCVLIALIAALVAWMVRARNVKHARRELEERRRASLVDPGLIPIALQIGQALGWRRLAALAGVGLFAAGLAREWFGERKHQSGDGDKE